MVTFMNKKFFTAAICFALCAILAVCTLSGCSKKKEKNGPSPSSSTASGTSSFVEQNGSAVTDTEDAQSNADTTSKTGTSSNKNNQSSSSNKTSTATGTSSKFLSRQASYLKIGNWMTKTAPPQVLQKHPQQLPLPQRQ